MSRDGFIRGSFGDLLESRDERLPNDGTHPLYSLTIKDGVTPKTERYEREFLVANKESKKYKVIRTGDLVFNPSNLRWGAIATSFIQFPVLASPVYEVFYPKDDQVLDPYFLGALASSPMLMAKYLSLVEGTLVERTALKKDDFLGIEIEIPPLPEQKKIAEILSGVERTISQTSQRIEKHKTLLLATLEEIFDYLGGKADLRPLGDCCRHILDFRGRTPAKLGMEWGGGTIRALSANNVRDGFIDFNRECYLGSESLYRNWMTRGDCERGDIVFTMEAPMGNVAIIPDEEKYILSQRVVLLSPDRQQILSEYLYWFMRSSRFRSDCENLATGTTAKGIKQANLLTISVPIATLEGQAKAVQLPTSMERLISSEEQRLLQLNLIKQSLSADLLSGRKRVSV